MKDLKKYLDNQMSEKETEAFTEKLIRSKFENEKKERWKKKLEEEYGISRDIGTGGKVRLIGMVLKIAAGAALLILALVFYPKLNKSAYLQLAEQYLAEEKFENNILRKGADELILLRQSAVMAYNSADFKQAVGYYQKIEESGQATTGDLFYHSLCWLYRNKSSEALPKLKAASVLSDQEAGEFRQEINWFLALALIKQSKPEQAKALLENIKEGEWNYAKARLLLEKME